MATLPNRPLNILAIDGGAMMGVIPTRILQYFEGTPANSYLYTGYNPGTATPPALPAGIVNGFDSQIFQNFDMIVGTSTGGLITMALTVPPGVEANGENSVPTNPMTVQSLLAFYFAQGENIFSSSPPNPLTSNGPMFGNLGLINAISSLYGVPVDGTIYSSQGVTPTHASAISRTFADVLTPALVTSFNNNNNAVTAGPGYNVVGTIDGSTQQGALLVGNSGALAQTTADNWGNPLSVIQGALMTSAFPMLLPPTPFDLNFSGDANAGDETASPSTINYFLDGGIFAGSPALAAYFWALRNGLQIGTLVSIGCGTTVAPTTAANTYNPVANWGSGSSEIIYMVLNDLEAYFKAQGDTIRADGLAGLIDILPKYVTATPGWLQSQSYTDGFYSELISIMQTGASGFAHQMLGAILGAQKLSSTVNGAFYRLQPDLGAAGGKPAYSSDPTTLTNWVDATDAWAKINASWLNGIVTQVKSVQAL